MVDGSTPSTSGTQMSNSSTPTTSAESARKRTVAEELEYAKIMKRRRPSLSTAPPPDENQAKLVAARLDLALATKANMEEQKKGDEEFFPNRKKGEKRDSDLVI
ncbi:uncharacterized protein LOC117652011 [Thrips palmi]|uniref:Uncharacterized protein LOC117652011 n=1 Tax=Thrips palmi TaxID=161013 RepID=A0A6P9A3U3_THRPL|nr:uncharacterized protein LOC117652011 [Thrips palmi]